MPTKRDVFFKDRHAPILDKTKHRRAIVKAALEDYVAYSEASPRDRAAARSILAEINRIERQRPKTTVCGMLALSGKTISVWVYEQELAPLGHCPQVTLSRNATLDHAIRSIRALSA